MGQAEINEINEISNPKKYLPAVPGLDQWSYIPYSGKFSREKTFMNLAIF